MGADSLTRGKRLQLRFRRKESVLQGTMHSSLFVLSAATCTALVFVGAACSSKSSASGPGALLDSGGVIDASFDTSTGTQDSGSAEVAVQDTGAGDSASSPDGTTASCSGFADAGPAAACATAGDAAASMVIDNTCAENVDLWWVSYQCTEVFYQQVPAGMTSMQSSFETHPWRIRLPDAGLVVKDIPPLGPGTTNVQVP